MGRSTPVRKLFCSKCKSKHWGKLLHFNIEIIGQKGEGMECGCRNCGHVCVTYFARGLSLSKTMNSTPLLLALIGHLVGNDILESDMAVYSYKPSMGMRTGVCTDCINSDEAEAAYHKRMERTI